MKGKKIAIAVIAIAAVVIASLFASGAVSTKSKGGEGAVKSTVTEQSIDHSLFYHTWQTDYSGVDDDFRQFYPSAVAFSETKATLEADKKDSSSYIIDGDKITITAGKEKIVYLKSILPSLNSQLFVFPTESKHITQRIFCPPAKRRRQPFIQSRNHLKQAANRSFQNYLHND